MSSNKDCGLAPWEIEYAQQQQEERRKNFQSFTRSQWLKKARKVTVPDTQCDERFTTKQGRTLVLFSIEKTREMTAQEHWNYFGLDQNPVAASQE